MTARDLTDSLARHAPPLRALLLALAALGGLVTANLDRELPSAP